MQKALSVRSFRIPKSFSEEREREIEVSSSRAQRAKRERRKSNVRRRSGHERGKRKKNEKKEALSISLVGKAKVCNSIRVKGSRGGGRGSIILVERL